VRYTYHRANAEDAFPAACDLHLLVELGRLCQKRFFVEILEAENVGATLGSRADETRRLCEKNGSTNDALQAPTNTPRNYFGAESNKNGEFHVPNSLKPRSWR